ncbi:MAG TPA: hypothetical protein VJY33_25725, partial [Isosphaeraceae bacterium]|nr:hypothetical protein [Isosphaeraceae bacterium]
AFYNIYVSDDGGPFTLWQSDTTATSATYTGVAGQTYGFYSVATDNVGNRQTTPTAAQATTQVVSAPPQPAVLQFAGAQFTANVTDGSTQLDLTRAGNLSTTVTVVVSSPGGHDVAGFQQTITFGPNATSAAVPVSIQNDGRPGEPDVAIPLSLSSPGPGATLGATASATLVVRDNNPFPPLVTVASLQPTTVRVKVGKGKRAKTKTETGLLLQFSGALAGTGNPAAYHLLTGKTKRGVTTFNKFVPLTVFNSTPSTVTLLPAGKLNLSQPEQLRVTAVDLIDAFGRPLNGGQSSVATFGNKVVTSARVKSQSRIGILSASVVDAVLGTVAAPRRNRK